jgi:hypothetical protein
MSLATRKNRDSFPIFWKKNIDHPQTEGRKNNDDTMALCYIHSRYCIHDTSNVVKFFIQIK